MGSIHLSDDDRLAEVGRILAEGALRIIKKNKLSSKTGIAVANKQSVNSGRTSFYHHEGDGNGWSLVKRY